MPTNPGAEEPSLFWMWGETQKAIGRLEQGLQQGLQSVHVRQDDMRRELLGHIKGVEKRLEGRRPAMTWMRWIPWDKLFFGCLTVAGTLGWIKPAWVKLITTLFGGG